jgi:hypothetical protein
MRDHLGKVISNSLEDVKRSSARWEFDGTVINASERGGWLFLETPVIGVDCSVPEWNLLRDNGALRGLCKYALSNNSHSHHLRADLPVYCGYEAGDLPRRILEACEGFHSALKQMRGAENSGMSTDGGNSCSETAPVIENDDLACLLDGSGWPFVAQSHLKCTAELEVRRGRSPAVIENQGEEGFLVYAEIAKWDGLSSQQREALGIFLLSSCGIVRMARATIVEKGEQATARYEVRLSAPSAQELGHSLAALSVAANLFGHEVQAFEDEGIAKAYLSARRGL